MENIARTPKQIGATIRRYRRLKDLTQAQLGEKTNLRQATVSALEKGETGPRLGTLVDVLAALGLEVVIRERSKPTDDIAELF